MQSISNQVYIEDQYPGVTLGVIALGHGLLQIDAPPSPEDGRSWRAAMLSLGSGVERLLINLDSHPDRSLGARAMDCTVIAHEKTAQAFRNRPNMFKAQGEETGADWEAVAGLGSVRWMMPEISFTDRMEINWNNFPVLMEHHPGPASGAIWAVLPEAGVVFVGDLVVKNQPPFLSNANLGEWVKSLDALSSLANQQYMIVSGRGGLITGQHLQAQVEMIGELHKNLEVLGGNQAGPDSVETLLPGILAKIKPPAEKLKQYTQRLRYGLRHYYLRRYYPSSNPDVDEE